MLWGKVIWLVQPWFCSPPIANTAFRRVLRKWFQSSSVVMWLQRAISLNAESILDKQLFSLVWWKPFPSLRMLHQQREADVENSFPFNGEASPECQDYSGAWKGMTAVDADQWQAEACVYLCACLNFAVRNHFSQGATHWTMLKNILIMAKFSPAQMADWIAFAIGCPRRAIPTE